MPIYACLSILILWWIFVPVFLYLIFAGNAWYFEVSPVLSVGLVWYDFWIGGFYDSKNNTLYLIPLPCIVIKLELNRMDEPYGL